MKRLIILITFVLAAHPLFAQSPNASAETVLTGTVSAETVLSQTVIGTVTDGKGNPVIGVVVRLADENGRGIGAAAVTDIEGRWSLDYGAIENAKISFSCLGFKPQTVEVQGRERIDIVLQEDVESLDEVVVVGYGYMRKSDLTGAVSSVKIDDNDAANSSSIDRMLVGKVSGVNVLSSSAAPDAGVDIRIRGTNSFNSDNEPLYVIDGVIINGGSETVSNLSHGTDNNESNMQTNGLLGINSQDIASIEILKDASATAIYGSEGANGVVLITTKVATRDKPSITAQAGVTVGVVNRRMEMLGFDDFIDFIAPRNRTLVSLVYENPENYTEHRREGLKVRPVNWQDEMLRPSVTQSYYVSLAGRPSKTSYFTSLGFRRNDGVLSGTGFSTATGRLNLSRTIGKNLSIDFKTNFSWSHTDMTQSTSGNAGLQGSFTRSLLAARPFRTLTNEDIPEESEDFESTSTSTPDKWLSDFVNTKDKMRVIPSVSARYKFTGWLSAKVSFGGEVSVTDTDRFKSLRISTSTGTTAAASKYLSARYNGDFTLDVNKSFKGGHRLSGNIGGSLSHRWTESEQILGWDILQYKGGTASVNTAESTKGWYSESDNSMMSAFLRAVYSYRDRYVLTTTHRLDGSSRFSRRNRWGYFPSFALAWRMSEEPWFRNGVVSMLKFRVGWGQVGNQTIGNYRTVQNYSVGTIPSSYNDPAYSQLAVWRSNVPNPDLRWETTEQTNVGLDLSLWKGRLSLSVEGYYKNTYDLLKSMIIPWSSGFGSISMNSGSVRNAGVEFSFESVPVKVGKRFEWTLGGNISMNRNRILDIGSGKESTEIRTDDGSGTVSAPYFMGASLTNGSPAINIFAEGLPMGLFYAYKFDGIVQEGETGPGFAPGETRGPGYIKYKDLNGNGYIDSGDRCVVGDPNPDFTFGFNTSLRWKSLVLSAAFVGSYGNDIFNLNLNSDWNVSNTSTNVRREAYVNAWTPENRSNVWPAVGSMTSEDYTDRYSDRYVEDGSFLRLANLTLSYDLRIRKKGSALRSITMGATAGNLFVLTKYSGWDPAVNSYGSNLMKAGVDNGSYPEMRSWTINLKFMF